MSDHLQKERLRKHLQDIYGTEPEYYFREKSLENEGSCGKMGIWNILI